MSAFEDKLNEYLGVATDKSDIRAIVRPCYYYDFDGAPVRMWRGRGKLHTIDGEASEHTWLGTIDGDGNDMHRVPRLSDGRDGTAPTYEFGFGYLSEEHYQAAKANRDMVRDRPLTIYLALFEAGEGLRPQTPIEFYKELTMISARFDESLRLEGTSLIRRYSLTIIAKDGNAGRSNVPGRTYADTMQREYARSLGVELDRGAEFLASLANRTYKQPN